MIVFFHQKNILEKDIKKVAIENGINFIDGEKIIVDDLTYFYFAKNRIPMPITYIFDENDPSSIHHFITQVNSSGIIVRCSYMPIAFQAYATRIGSICGISKDNIKKLPISGW